MVDGYDRLLIVERRPIYSRSISAVVGDGFENLGLKVSRIATSRKFMILISNVCVISDVRKPAFNFWYLGTGMGNEL